MLLDDLLDIFDREVNLSREVRTRDARRHALAVVICELTKIGALQKASEEAICARLSKLPGTP